MTGRDDGARVARSARTLRGDPVTWRAPGGYPESLALCIIDSVQSLPANYNSVPPVLNRYRAYRSAEGGDADHDSVAELLATFKNGAQAWSESIGAANKAPGTNILKSEAIHRAAESLKAIGVRSTADLRATAYDGARRNEVERAWRGVSGLGKASWDYLLILVGEDGVKADIMIRRFVTAALGEPELVTPERAHRAVTLAAAELGVAEKALDYTIWRFESNRAGEADEEPTEATHEE